MRSERLAYEPCLTVELTARGLTFERQVPLAGMYRGVPLRCAYRADLIIERQLLVELKCVDTILPVHHAQVLTYLRLSKMPQGLLINFNSRVLREGLKSFLMNHEADERLEQHEA